MRLRFAGNPEADGFARNTQIMRKAFLRPLRSFENGLEFFGNIGVHEVIIAKGNDVCQLVITF